MSWRRGGGGCRDSPCRLGGPSPDPDWLTGPSPATPTSVQAPGQPLAARPRQATSPDTAMPGPLNNAFGGEQPARRAAPEPLNSHTKERN